MENWAECSTVIVIAICVTVYQIVKLRCTDVAGELERLAELKSKCLLTNDEFEKRKRKILGK